MPPFRIAVAPLLILGLSGAACGGSSTGSTAATAGTGAGDQPASTPDALGAE